MLSMVFHGFLFHAFHAFMGSYLKIFAVPCEHGKHGNFPKKTMEFCSGSMLHAPWFSRESMEFSPWFFHGFPTLSVPGLLSKDQGAVNSYFFSEGKSKN